MKYRYFLIFLISFIMSLFNETVSDSIVNDDISENRIINIIDSLPHSSKLKFWKKRRLDAIEFIILHHSSIDETVNQIAKYHVNGRKWKGIGYHFVIDKDGKIYQTNHLTTISNHCKGQNKKSISICVIGNYDIEQVNPKVKESLEYLREVLENDFNLTKIYGHSEFSNTKCPGTNLLKLIK